MGEIEDEFDLPDTSIERIDDKHIRVDGTYTIGDFNEHFGPSSSRRTSTRSRASSSVRSGARRRSGHSRRRTASA